MNPSGGMDLGMGIPFGMNPALGVSVPSEIVAGDPRSQTSQGMLASSVASSLAATGAASIAQPLSAKPALDANIEDEQRHGRGWWLWIAVAMLLVLMVLALGGLIWLFPR
jgi:hypothetical protein